MDKDYVRTSPPDCYDIFRWPEFQAFADRLGIPLHLRTIDLTIKLVNDGLCVITHEYQAEDRNNVPPKPGAVETTNLHNKEWRTHQPRAREPEPETDEPTVVGD